MDSDNFKSNVFWFFYRMSWHSFWYVLLFLVADQILDDYGAISIARQLVFLPCKLVYSVNKNSCFQFEILLFFFIWNGIFFPFQGFQAHGRQGHAHVPPAGNYARITLKQTRYIFSYSLKLHYQILKCFLICRYRNLWINQNYGKLAIKVNPFWPFILRCKWSATGPMAYKGNYFQRLNPYNTKLECRSRFIWATTTSTIKT